ncbi:MAG: hypothetical protein O3A00_14300 [Planctomycetota bacterium]|nr:hypothetical protein [Planctomycetota bacterium]
MSFLIDTDICSAYLKGDCQVWKRFMQYDLNDPHQDIYTLADGAPVRES